MAGSGVGGVVQLCIAGDEVGVVLDAENLTPGHTYTAWLTYLDHDRPWGDDRASVDQPAPAGLAGRFDMRVAEARARSFSVEVRGVRPSARSEITVSLFGWGPADPPDERSRAKHLLLRTLAVRTPASSVVSADETGPRLAFATFALQPHSAEDGAGGRKGPLVSRADPLKRAEEPSGGWARFRGSAKLVL